MEWPGGGGSRAGRRSLSKGGGKGRPFTTLGPPPLATIFAFAISPDAGPLAHLCRPGNRALQTDANLGRPISELQEARLARPSVRSLDGLLLERGPSSSMSLLRPTQ
jgi:hypothetical protein